LRLVFGLIGFVTMGASPIAYSRAIFGWFDPYRGRALGLMLAGAGVSGILLPPAAQALIAAFGWRIAWLALGTITLVFAVPAAARFIRERQSPAGSSRSALPGVPLKEALASRAFWTLTVAVFGGTIAVTGTLVHVVALLADRGVPSSRAALALSAMGGASLIGRLVCGWLLDRFAAPRVAMVLLAISAAGTFMLAGAQSLAMAVLATACIGFGSGGEVDVTPYLLARYFGSRSQSTLYGLTWTAWGLAGAAGPMLMGRAFDSTGTYTTMLIQLGFVTLAVAGLMLTLPAPRLRAVAEPRPATATSH
jgi:predicted MFS family arabinose efflux permease